RGAAKAMPLTALIPRAVRVQRCLVGELHHDDSPSDLLTRASARGKLSSFGASAAGEGVCAARGNWATEVREVACAGAHCGDGSRRAHRSGGELARHAAAIHATAA